MILATGYSHRLFTWRWAISVYHIWWLIPLGLAITLFGWLRGLLTRA